MGSELYWPDRESLERMNTRVPEHWRRTEMDATKAMNETKATAESKSVTQHHLNALDGLINYAHETFTAIEHRLSDITFDSEPAESVPTEKYGGPSPLSEAIGLSCRRVNDLNERMQSLLRSIDL